MYSRTVFTEYKWCLKPSVNYLLHTLHQRFIFSNVLSFNRTLAVQRQRFGSDATATPLESNSKEDTDAVEQSKRHRFIPMTRRTLLRKLMEEESLVPSQDHLIFERFAAGLDRAIARNFHGVLGELKTLYDPLNPDKETMVVGNVGRKARMDNEFWLLQRLAKLLHGAHFDELLKEVISEALKEHPVYEGVLVSVDTSKYDVLRFWVLGQEYGKTEFFGVGKVSFFFKTLFRKEAKEVLIYKRVVLAVRTKRQSKLSLKAFKDVPSNSLEYLLPEGRIRMSKSDKGILATTIFVGISTGLIKLVISLTSFDIKITYIAGAVMALLALRAWNAYKNKRNSYLVNLSKLLYYKTVANNRALLALIVDRTEDEMFKANLIAYTFLKASRRLTSEDDPTDVSFSSGGTAEELKNSIESWMKDRFGLNVNFDPVDATSNLFKMNLLKKELKENCEVLYAVDLREAIEKLPVPPDDALFDREEDLDVEQLLPENEIEILGNAQMNDKEEEQKRPEWS